MQKDLNVGFVFFLVTHSYSINVACMQNHGLQSVLASPWQALEVSQANMCVFGRRLRHAGLPAPKVDPLCQQLWHVQSTVQADISSCRLEF